jgi:hypothetical protein
MRSVDREKRKKIMPYIIFQELNKIIFRTKEWKELFYVDPFLHRLFHGLRDICATGGDDKASVSYLMNFVLEILKNQKELSNKLQEKLQNSIQLNNYNFSKELLIQYIDSLSFKEKFKLLFLREK